MNGFYSLELYVATIQHDRIIYKQKRPDPQLAETLTILCKSKLDKKMLRCRTGRGGS